MTEETKSAGSMPAQERSAADKKKYPASLARTAGDAFVRSIPVFAGYVVLGIGFGILLRDAGYGTLWSLAMSLFIFAGSAQYVGVSLLSAQVSLLTAGMTTLMVNARHLFYSISMVDKYRGAGRKKPYLIFALTDETYSLLCDWDVPEGENPHLFALLVSAFNQGYWVLGSVLGCALGGVLPFSTEGIAFSMTALFIATMVEQYLTSEDHTNAIVGGICSVICLVIFGPSQFLIPSMISITLALSLLRGRLDQAAESETDRKDIAAEVKEKEAVI